MDGDLALKAIPALADNYIWALACGNEALVVDPGEAAPVLDYLDDQQLKLRAILITHKHHDHVGGVEQLKREWPDARLVVPIAEPQPDADTAVDGGDSIDLEPFGAFKVLDTPGHTRGHICYVHERFLFCGDALFAGACGRLFEGVPDDLLANMVKLAALPGETLLCCGHEYSLTNLKFIQQVEPDNPDVQTWQATAQRQVDSGQPTLPVTLAADRLVNPFQRYKVQAVRDAAARYVGAKLDTDVAVIGALRKWRDTF